MKLFMLEKNIICLLPFQRNRIWLFYFDGIVDMLKVKQRILNPVEIKFR